MTEILTGKTVATREQVGELAITTTMIYDVNGEVVDPPPVDPPVEPPVDPPPVDPPVDPVPIPPPDARLIAVIDPVTVTIVNKWANVSFPIAPQGAISIWVRLKLQKSALINGAILYDWVQKDSTGKIIAQNPLTTPKMEVPLTATNRVFEFTEKCVPLANTATIYFSVNLDGTWESVENCTLELWAESLGQRP